jgi:hypothetical protein
MRAGTGAAAAVDPSWRSPQERRLTRMWPPAQKIESIARTGRNSRRASWGQNMKRHSTDSRTSLYSGQTREPVGSRTQDYKMTSTVLREAGTKSEFAAARLLFEEYVKHLAIDLAFRILSPNCVNYRTYMGPTDQGDDGTGEGAVCKDLGHSAPIYPAPQEPRRPLCRLHGRSGHQRWLPCWDRGCRRKSAPTGHQRKVRPRKRRCTAPACVTARQRARPVGAIISARLLYSPHALAARPLRRGDRTSNRPVYSAPTNALPRQLPIVCQAPCGRRAFRRSRWLA